MLFLTSPATQKILNVVTISFLRDVAIYRSSVHSLLGESNIV